MNMDGGTIFTIIWFIAVIFILTTLYRRGKNALSIFPDIDSVNVLFREKRASGYSTQSTLTKMGGARNALDIVVTDKELWIRSMLLLASFGQQYDLLHRIPVKDILSINRNRKKVTIDFNSGVGQQKQVVLKIKNTEKFLNAINELKTMPNNGEHP